MMLHHNLAILEKLDSCRQSIIGNIEKMMKYYPAVSQEGSTKTSFRGQTRTGTTGGLVGGVIKIEATG